MALTIEIAMETIKNINRCRRVQRFFIKGIGAANICTTSHVKVSDQVKHFGWLAKAKLHCKAGISLTCMNLIRGTNNLGWEKYHCSIVGDAWLLHIMYSYN